MPKSVIQYYVILVINFDLLDLKPQLVDIKIAIK